MRPTFLGVVAVMICASILTAESLLSQVAAPAGCQCKVILAELEQQAELLPLAPSPWWLLSLKSENVRLWCKQSRLLQLATVHTNGINLKA